MVAILIGSRIRWILSSNMSAYAVLWVKPCRRLSCLSVGELVGAD